MDILDIAIAKQLAGGGGGSGTDNYNDLSNLPKINDVTLSGNKSSSALGLQSEITSENKLDSDLIDDTDQDNKFVTSSEKNIWNAKQNAIDADHKLNADYVDDSTSTNKFVTASDKEAWNAKQNAIDNSHKLSSDLVDDANHTNKFVTSTEKNTWNGKQNAIDSEHKLSSSLVSFTTAEAAALASGIDSTKVAQISTNQSNILYTLGKTGKNLVNPELFTEGGYISDTSSGIVIVSNTSVYMDYLMISPNTEYFITSIGSSGSWGAWYDSNKNFISGINAYGMETSPANAKYIRCTVSYNNLNPNYATTFMICTKADYDASPDYQAYRGLPNYDLTRLEAEDRASLAEVVDSGAKNCYVPDNLSTAVGGLTITRESDGTTIKINGTYTGSDYAYINIGHFVMPNAGTYFISAVCTKPMTGSVYYAYTKDNFLTLSGSGQPTSHNYTSIPTTVPAVYIRITPNTSFNNDTVKILICTKAAFGVSNKFVPYRVPIKGVYVRDTDVVCSTTLTTTGIKFTATEKAAYRITATAIYYNSIPLKLVIKYKTNSSANQLPFCSATHADGEDVSLIASGIISLDVGGEFEVFAQYASSTSNYFYVLVEKIG